MIRGTRSKSTKKVGHGGRALRAACGASIATAALVGTFASVSNAHAITLPVGITLPGLPPLDAGSITLPVPGSDAGVIIGLPLIPTDAGTVKLPLIGEDGGIVSLPGLGEDSGVAIVCTSDASCLSGFSCEEDLKLCLPTLLEADSGAPDAGTDGSGSGDASTRHEDGGDESSNDDGGASGSGGSSGAGGDDGSPDASTGSSPASGAVSGGVSGDATASGGGASATIDAGADGDAAGDDNGVSCAMSPAKSGAHGSIPFELVTGFVAIVTFGAIRRRRRAAR